LVEVADRDRTVRVLASELGAELYRAELSGLNSKYIGETEADRASSQPN
jgi:hypothetical protein